MAPSAVIMRTTLNAAWLRIEPLEKSNNIKLWTISSDRYVFRLLFLPSHPVAFRLCRNRGKHWTEGEMQSTAPCCVGYAGISGRVSGKRVVTVALGRSALYSTKVGEINHALLHLTYSMNIASLEQHGHKLDWNEDPHCSWLTKAGQKQSLIT